MTNLELQTSFRYRKPAERLCGFQFRQNQQLREAERQQQHLQHLRKQLGLGIRSPEETNSSRSLEDVEQDELISKILGRHRHKLNSNSRQHNKSEDHSEISTRFLANNFGIRSTLKPADASKSKLTSRSCNSMCSRNQLSDLSKLSLVPLCSCAETKMYRLGVKPGRKQRYSCTFEKSSMSNYFTSKFCCHEDLETGQRLSAKKLGKPQLCVRIEPWREYVLQSSSVCSGQVADTEAATRNVPNEVSTEEVFGKSITARTRFPTDLLSADRLENSSTTNSTSERNGNKEKLDASTSSKRTITVVMPSSQDDCPSRDSDPVSRCATRFLDPPDEMKVTSNLGGLQSSFSDYDTQSVYRTAYTHFDKLVARGPTMHSYSLLTPVNNPW